MEFEIKDKVDELFHSIGKYRRSSEFQVLLNFCRRFHYLSAYNAMLVQMQRPGATFVHTAGNWEKRFNIRVKQNANPLIILVPFGPVDYVFDIEDTEGESKKLIPESILRPFKTKGTLPSSTYKTLANNLKYYGIKLESVTFGSQQHARIERLDVTTYVDLPVKYKKDQYIIYLPEYYLISINNKSTKEEVFAALIHELAHFFCLHLSPVDRSWWDTRNLYLNEREFEAETVAWLICERIGIENPSAEYLSGYLDTDSQIPNISLETILKVTNTIEGLFAPQRIADGLLAKQDEEVKKQLLGIKN